MKCLNCGMASGNYAVCAPCSDAELRMVARRPTATGTEAEVCKDIAERQQGGIAKYNTTVRDNPLSLRQWLQHAYEECLDQAVYLKRAMEEMDRG